MPIHAPFWASMVAILGLSLRTVRLRIGLDQPAHYRFNNLALRCGGGIEHGEVEQVVGKSSRANEHASYHNKEIDPSRTLHANEFNIK